MYGPIGKPVKATLVKHSTDDGIDFIRDEVKLGTTYEVYPESIRIMLWGRLDTGGKVERKSIWAVNKDTGRDGYLPLELLKLEGN